MNTKITAILTAAVFAITPALSFGADYYPNVEFPQFESSDFIAKPIDINTYYKAEEAVRFAAINNKDELINALDNLESVVSGFQTSYVLYYISASQNNTEENNALLSEAYSVISDVSERISNLVFELYDNLSTRYIITEWVGGDDAMDAFLDSRPSKVFYELNEKENELLTQYRNSEFASYQYKADDGNTYTLSELETELYSILDLLNSETDNDNFDYGAAYTRYQKVSDYILDYFNKSGTQLARIFSSLVKVRDEIAKEEGFANYADYAHLAFYGRDYNTSDIAMLRESTKKYIVPLSLKLESVIANADTSPLSHEEIIPTVAGYIGKISRELEKSFSYLTKSGLLDMDYSESKVTPGTAYTIDIPEYGVPFVFISPIENYTTWTLETLVHEFGHFNANLYNSLASYDNSITYTASNVDLSEIHSQGLELLFADYYDEIYLSNSDITYLASLQSMLNSIIDGCLYDEWQEGVYENPNMSIEEMNELFRSVSESYGKEEIYDYMWVQVPHNFEEPMYYISYAVSAVAALDLWSLSIKERDSAVDRYMRTTAYTADTPFKETLSILGYDDIFSENTIKAITDTISSFATLGYRDVTVDDWYWQAVVETDVFLDNAVNDGNFRGDENILRCEMVNSIGKLHEYFGNAVTGFATAFLDIDGEYIGWAVNDGIVNGYDEYTFGSYDNLTREQAAVMIYRYFGESYSPNTSSLESFGDYKQVSDWAYEAVLWAVDEGIIQGTDDVMLAPQSPVTRAQAAQMMSRFMYYMNAINL